MAVVIIMMAAATVIEKLYGSHTAFSIIYRSPIFSALWALLSIAGLLFLIIRKAYKKTHILLLHIALIVILIGALITKLTGESGEMHLRCGESQQEWVSKQGFRRELPFSLTLQEYRTEYYTSSTAASDYISTVTLTDHLNQSQTTYTISMNHILKYRGYRFYQASYDSDGMGSYLSVSHDPWGVRVTYSGYMLLLMAIIGFFFFKNSGFWRAVAGVKRHLSTLIVLLIIGTATLHASDLPHTPHVLQEKTVIQLHDSIARPFVPAVGSITLGILLFAAICIMMAQGRKMPIALNKSLLYLSIVLFAYITVVLGLRWYISGHVPMAGGYSVMMVMAWTVSVVMILLYRIHIIQTIGFILAGFTMLVASLAFTDSQIDHLAPVLNSPLLSIHVLCMMISYTLFGLAALIGVMGVLIRRSDSLTMLRDLSLTILYPALFILTVGTFLGAVWANISWGNYWSWDPKETWALITMLVYSFMLHSSSLSKFRNPRFFHIYSIAAFASVLITYFGVNLILGGMHSYA